ncbi:MAG: cysteine--tRNA ligase, partial [Myxococcota bacterium]|nr:cysteine--tRNA ligase [Myxococcota bacterium]
TGEEPLALAQRFIDAFHEDVDQLGLVRPDLEPRVSTSIQDIQDLIGKLVDRDHAYVNEGTVWFSVGTFAEYGKLSGQKVDELRSPDEVPGKRHPADFALWKAVKPGEPSWDSPWGPGRPGWHIECSAMSGACLGETIDIHGGGLDLVFPHHENEVAQSECGHGVPFTRYWMHNGMLTMSSGQKMGKSLGNVINIRDALAAFPAECLRLYYLQNLYRSPLPWGDAALPDALGMLARLYEARDVAQAMGGQEAPEALAEQLGADAIRVLELGRSFTERFYAALDDDFNTAQALGYAFELARAINRFGNHKKARKRGGPIVAPALEALTHVTAALSLLGMDAAGFQEEVKAKRLTAMGISRDEVEAKVAERMQARADRDWARADGLRDELDALQILVMDTPDGCEWRVRLQAPDAE